MYITPMDKGDGGKSGGKGSGINDLLLWKAFTRDIRPLGGGPDWEDLEDQAQQEARRAPEKAGSESALLSAAQPKQPAPDQGKAQLDRRTEERFKKGKLKIEGRLDLHGLKQDEAHAALTDFVQAAHAAGKRCVIVITGKGTARSSKEQEEQIHAPARRGILKQRAPEWLTSPPLASIVLKIAPAQPKDGGSGAFYVYLKRSRP